MLADRSRYALIENFAGQWLFLRDLAHVQTEVEELRRQPAEAFQKETQLLFDWIVREDRSLTRSAGRRLHASWTSGWREHYGIPDIHGSYFRRCRLPPTASAAACWARAAC